MSNPDAPIREPEEIHQPCSMRLHNVEASPLFLTILVRLLCKDRATFHPAVKVIKPDENLLGRIKDQAGLTTFLGSSADLIKIIHFVGGVAELDGDEIGYLVARVAEIKR